MILKTVNLCKFYTNGRKEVRAVDGVSLEIEKAKAMAILGPSGAGKSTLLHLLGGLDRPTSGEVMLDGVGIYSLTDSERARIRNRRVGFVFQFYNLLPEFTALENVMLPAMIKGVGRRAKGRGLRAEGRGIKEKAGNILKDVGLGGRMGHRPLELSGGESQRVAIARALINDPEILLCDEPTGNLDSKNSEAIYELLFRLKTNSEMCLVIVTHNEDISARVNEVIHLKDGRAV